MPNLPNDRSSLPTAMAWVAHITTIAMEMTVPPVLGHFADRWLGTVAVFTLVGAFLGLGAGMMSLLQLAKSRNSIKHRDGVDGSKGASESEHDR